MFYFHTIVYFWASPKLIQTGLVHSLNYLVFHEMSYLICLSIPLFKDVFSFSFENVSLTFVYIFKQCLWNYIMKCSMHKKDSKEHACAIKNNIWMEPQHKGSLTPLKEPQSWRELVWTGQGEQVWFLTHEVGRASGIPWRHEKTSFLKVKAKLAILFTDKAPVFWDWKIHKVSLFPLKQAQVGKTGHFPLLPLSTRKHSDFFLLMLFTVLRSPVVPWWTSDCLLQQFWEPSAFLF